MADVKPLRWDKHPDKEEYYGGGHENLVEMNEYDILPHPCAVGYFVLDIMGNRYAVDFTCVQDAKDTAQDDWEDRINAALM